MIMSFPQKGTCELRARSTAPETNKSIVGIAARYANVSSRAGVLHGRRVSAADRELICMRDDGDIQSTLTGTEWVIERAVL